MRRGLVSFGLIALFGLLIAASAGASSGNQIQPFGFSVGALASPPTADLDGDKVFEDLEARLETAESDDKLAVLVQLERKVTRVRFDALNETLGGVELNAWLPIVNGFAATVTASQLKRLVGVPGVAQVELNGAVHAYNDSAQASFGVTRARAEDPDLDGSADGAATYSRDDIVVAVIDTGIDAAHPQLDEGKVIGFADCVDGSCVAVMPFDDNDHGTHVAGTIAGDGDGNPLAAGVAPGAALVGVKVLPGSGPGSDAGVIAGIQWAMDNAATLGIEVLNLSLGADGCFNANQGMTSQAVNNAVAAGLRVFVAAGNRGPGRCTVGSPGVATSVVTVGAMADTGTRFDATNRARVPGFALAPFSSRGPTFDDQIKPDVVGPGVDITSADANTTGYVVFQGTSMATPFVAGVAALMLDHNPALTAAQIKSTLMATAVDWGRGGIFHVPGTSGPDVDYGAGRLDAFAAIRSLPCTTLGVPPAAPAHAIVDGDLSGDGDSQRHPVSVASIAFPLAATLIMTEFVPGSPGQPDFDLFLRAPNGTTVLLSSDFGNSRQEEVGILPPIPGTYFLDVESFSGDGPYILDISGGAASSAPPPSQPPCPTPPVTPPPNPPPPAPPPPAPQPPPPTLPPPPPRTPAVVRCVVPNVKGRTVPKAKAALKARRCIAGRIKHSFSGKVRKGRVIAQSRRPGARLPRNTKVNLTVSKGARKK